VRRVSWRLGQSLPRACTPASMRRGSAAASRTSHSEIVEFRLRIAELIKVA
jgi:hypothetical protein